MANYHIVKQFVPNSPVWVVKLDPTDTVYEYETEEEATTALPDVQALYPAHMCRVQPIGVDSYGGFITGTIE